MLALGREICANLLGPFLQLHAVDCGVPVPRCDSPIPLTKRSGGAAARRAPLTKDYFYIASSSLRSRARFFEPARLQESL